MSRSLQGQSCVGSTFGLLWYLKGGTSSLLLVSFAGISLYIIPREVVVVVLLTARPISLFVLTDERWT